MGRQDGKVALITGGASGIGLAVAERLVDEGARVVLADLDPDRLAVATDKLGDVSTGAQIDVRVEADVARAVQTAVERFGRLDIAVNSAGLGGFGPVTDLDEEQW